MTQNNQLSPTKIRDCSMVSVIQITEVRGAGTQQDPYRLVHSYWSKEGVLLADQEMPVDPTAVGEA